MQQINRYSNLLDKLKIKITMKVLLINGSPRQKGNTYTALNEVAQQLNKQSVESEIMWIGNKAVRG